MSTDTLRYKVYTLLEKDESGSGLGRKIDLFLMLLITVNVISVILESVAYIHTNYGLQFWLIEFFSVAVFSIEYALRLWTCVENPKYKNRRFPRLVYMISPMAVIDLLAILPVYFIMFFNVDLRFLRVLRLLRILKLTRYSTAMVMLLDVFKEETNALLAAIFILLVLLVLAASGAYLVEHNAQPDKFGSIPSAMWWAVATLTTVGYGDVTPITIIGKVFGACITVIGIGMAALPAGILTSGLADHLRRRREALMSQFRLALEDGQIDEDEEEEIEALRKELGISHRAVKHIREVMHQEAKSRAKLPHCPHCGERLHHH
jgi:voltage-gated potassium channel